MSTAQSLIDDVRARIVEENADFFTSDTPILRWLNQGYRDFCAKTFMLDKTVGFRITQYQYEYDLPTDCLAVQKIKWNDQYDVTWRDQEEFSRYAGFSDNTTDRPYTYTIFPSTSKFRIYPIPNADSIAANLNNGGVMNTSQTSMTLSFASGNLPTRCRVLVQSEQMLIYNIDFTNGLTRPIVRGDGFTTAATHADLLPAYHLPLTMQYAYMPPDMVVGTVDCRLPNWYDEAIINYAAAICFRAKDKYETADRCQRIYKEIVERAMGEVVKQQRDRLPCIKDDFIAEGL